jgi:hypothetical protein
MEQRDFRLCVDIAIAALAAVLKARKPNSASRVFFIQFSFIRNDSFGVDAA